MESPPQIGPEERSSQKSYAEECAERAGKTFYWKMDGMPIKEIYNETGTHAIRYGLVSGEWRLDFPGSALFLDEAQSISEDEFNSLLS